MIAPRAIRKATGRNARYPVAMNEYGALFTVVMNPSVISSATPRPASMSTRVAMIGWMPTTETSRPFHAPRASETPSATTSANMTVGSPPGSLDASMIVSATAPETAMIAPTDRSIPRVAMTIVIPSATSMRGALVRRMSISTPYSCPSRTVTTMNCGRTIVLIRIRARSAVIGQNSRWRKSFFMLRSLRRLRRCSR